MQRYGERLFKPEAVPLVIDGENLALDVLLRMRLKKKPKLKDRLRK